MIDNIKISGYYCRRQSDEILRSLEKSLLFMGIQSVTVDYAKQKLYFNIPILFKKRYVQLPFSAHMIGNCDKLLIECYVMPVGNTRLLKTLQWYVDNRNKNMQKWREFQPEYDIRQNQDRSRYEVIMSGSLKSSLDLNLWMNRAFHTMCQQLRNDYPCISQLTAGEISGEIGEDIRREYEAYQEEWKVI